MDSQAILELINLSFQKRIALQSKLVECCKNEILHAASAVVDCFREGGKVILFGNGGSAADAQHIAAELVGRFVLERDSLPAIALTTDSSILTAISNDYGYEHVFARQVQALGNANDVAIAISTSGSSRNVLEAVIVSRNKSMRTIALTGGSGGQLAKLADIGIVIPSTNTAYIQECHMAIAHILCEIVDQSVLEGYIKVNANKAWHRGSKIIKMDDLSQLHDELQRNKKTVVWTNGCFDMLHPGHIDSLQAAKKLGDVLVVGVNSDASVRQLKGPERPILPAKDRVKMLVALDCVDYVVVFNDLTPIEALTRLQPSICCKGADYAPPSGKPLPEALVVDAYGGKMAFLPLEPRYSTTKLIKHIRDIDEKSKTER